MLHRAVHVAEHATGQGGVQEQRTVVVGDGLAQRQPDAQAACHHAPAPGAEHGGEQPETEGAEQGEAVDPAQPVEEGAGAEPPHQHAEDADPGECAYSGP